MKLKNNWVMDVKKFTEFKDSQIFLILIDEAKLSLACATLLPDRLTCRNKIILPTLSLLISSMNKPNSFKGEDDPFAD